MVGGDGGGGGGVHTFELTVLGDANPASTNAWVQLVGVDVWGGAMTTTSKVNVPFG